MISSIVSYERVLQKVERRQISWVGHMIRHDILTNTVLQGRVEGIRKRGRPKRNWMDYVYEMTGISTLYLIIM